MKGKANESLVPSLSLPYVVLSMEKAAPFAGYSRRRATRWTVRAGEILARGLITVGGIGTIIAVALVLVFLVWVVAPLFLGASVIEADRFPLSRDAGRPIRTAVDEYQLAGWNLFSDGTLEVFRLDTGK